MWRMVCGERRKMVKLDRDGIFWMFRGNAYFWAFPWFEGGGLFRISEKTLNKIEAAVLDEKDALQDSGA